jgi:hypothetical protein
LRRPTGFYLTDPSVAGISPSLADVNDKEGVKHLPNGSHLTYRCFCVASRSTLPMASRAELLGDQDAANALQHQRTWQINRFSSTFLLVFRIDLSYLFFPTELSG